MPNESSFSKPLRSRKVRFISLVVIFLVSGFFLPFLIHILEDSSAFKIENISIKTQSEHVKNENLTAFLAEFKGQSLYSVKISQIKEKTKQFPWVKTVLVRRFPPHDLQIEFLEYVPLAQITLDKTYLVDEQGTLFEPATPKDAINLPIITVDNIAKPPEEPAKYIKSAISALQAHKTAQLPGGMISQITIDKNFRIKAKFKNGLKIRLGKDNYPQKWEKLNQILAKLGKKNKVLDYAYLDDYPNTQQVAIKLKNI